MTISRETKNLIKKYSRDEREALARIAYCEQFGACIHGPQDVVDLLVYDDWDEVQCFLRDAAECGHTHEEASFMWHEFAERVNLGDEHEQSAIVVDMGEI